jgi:hypothetical protein
MEAALQHLRAEGVVVQAMGVARLSPLGHHHINFQGCYAFTPAESVAQEALRPFHDPRASEE